MNNPYFETYGDCEKAWNEAIAARDKWWVERIQKEVFDGGCYILRENTKATCEKCGAYPICHMVKWQQLKLSLQSSSALTNLMGKFPDLPDVREVGQ